MTESAPIPQPESPDKKYDLTHRYDTRSFLEKVEDIVSNKIDYVRQLIFRSPPPVDPWDDPFSPSPSEPVHLTEDEKRNRANAEADNDMARVVANENVEILKKRSEEYMKKRRNR